MRNLSGSLSPVNKSSPQMFPARLPEGGERLEKGGKARAVGEVVNFRGDAKTAI
ncbi:MAG: hypothetical protein ACR652_06170 [Methylocystis sp.]|uniref:hypothetical protein n=1 Tax=Methylocystis sp. TaxID=1911079 RepID=UPI003DA3671A